MLHGIPVAAQCRSDCDLDNGVEMADLVTVVDMILEVVPNSACPLGADENDDGELSVGDVVAAIHVAHTGNCAGCLAQCGDGLLSCDEVCDGGGTCVGGAKSGTACTSDAACDITEPGRCTGGLLAFHQCMSDDDCGGGACQRCVVHGGQTVPGGTCAADCTLETTIPLTWEPGVVDGVQLSSGSGITTTTYGVDIGPVVVPLRGSTVLRTGAVATGGLRPTTVRAADVLFLEVPVSTLACACIRAIAAKTCGGVLRLLDGSAANDCTPGYTDGDSACGGNQPPCTYVHGEGNAGSGFIGCDGLAPLDVDISLQLPNLEASVFLGGEGGLGSSLLLQHLAIAVKQGSCTDFCSETDPQAQRGTVRPQFFTTGTASAEIIDAEGVPQPQLGSVTVQGQALSCSALVESPTGLRWVSSSAESAAEVAALTTIELQAE